MAWQAGCLTCGWVGFLPCCDPLFKSSSCVKVIHISHLSIAFSFDYFDAFLINSAIALPALTRVGQPRYYAIQAVHTEGKQSLLQKWVNVIVVFKRNSNLMYSLSFDESFHQFPFQFASLYSTECTHSKLFVLFKCSLVVNSCCTPQ